MELGMRLKQARLEAGLSQRQLCGEEITRNMLSQIENGSARPSMGTLEYLAKKLCKPISYFLEEDAVLSPNQQIMEQARQHYTRGDWQQVLKALEQYREPDGLFDPERYLVEALSLMGLAAAAVTEGKDVYARTLLQEAKQAGDRSNYYTPALERERILLMSQAGVQPAGTLLQQLPEDHREQLLRAQAALSAGEYARCAALLDGMPDAAPQWYFLRGQADLGMGAYQQAVGRFLCAEVSYPGQCAQALEICYRELGDYKNAYLYACKQRERNL